MTTKFLVGKFSFVRFADSVDYARRLAETENRSVDIDCEISSDVTKVERKWVAKMHPPGFQRTTLMDLSA